MPLAVAGLWWLAVAVLGGFALGALGAFELSKELGNRIEWVIFVAAAVVCGARAALVPQSRLIWGLFGAGLSLYALGWITYFELKPEGSPNWSDALWLSLYPLAFTAVAFSIRARLRRARTWLWLDGSIAGLALVSIALRVCLGPVLEGSTETTLTIVTGASYMGADLLMLGVLIALFTLQRGLSRSDALLLAAFVLIASMDAVYAYQVAHGLSWVGSVDDAIWGVAALLLARAAWAPQEYTARATETTVRTLVPAVAALCAVTYELSASTHSVAAIVTLGTVVLVTARLWLSGRESAELLKQVSASRDQLRATIDNMSGVVFFAKDREGRYVLVNREFENIFGRDIVGLTDDDLFPPQTVAQLRATDAEVMRSGGVIETEERIPHPDGGERTYISVKFPYVGPGADGGVCGIGTDISQRIRGEQERRDLEAQLHQSQKLETVGRLAGGIAHDFNNLLAVILNYAEFASSELDSHPARADVDEIRAAAERAAGLTRQLLVFSRGGRTEATAIDVNAVVRDMSSLLGRTLGERVELHTDLSVDAPVAHADPTHVEQVLMNLAVNARDAMEDGGRLAIATSWEIIEGVPYVRMTVSDTGSGMSPETLARAFDPFFTTKAPGQGTGLGLATVYGLVTSAGGQVQCTSAPGHGTAVSVFLPVAHGAPAEQAEQGLHEAAMPDATVLLVEDEEALRRMARRLLEREGYSVISAPSGAAALEALDSFGGHVDVLLSDVVMPGMSGVDLAEEVQSRLPGVPLVFMSGYSEGADQLPAGSRFVPKPFKGAELLAAVAASAQSLRAG